MTTVLHVSLANKLDGTSTLIQYKYSIYIHIYIYAYILVDPHFFRDLLIFFGYPQNNRRRLFQQPAGIR